MNSLITGSARRPGCRPRKSRVRVTKVEDSASSCFTLDSRPYDDITTPVG